MHNSFFKPLITFFIFLFLTSLACSSLTPTAIPETNYRYDNLPDAGQDDKTVAKFRVISQWGKSNLTYYFINGTEKINGGTERDLIRAAFALWADETPLIFTEARSG